MRGKVKSSDIADFYQQLALLVRSNLPLPESLRQLGNNFPKKSFRNAVMQIAERTSRGESFSDAVRSYPHFFSPIHIRLISAGEQAGTLPETLFTVARFSRFCQLLTTRVRDIASYPLFAIHLCLITALFISIKAIPAFDAMFEEMFQDFMRIPLMTRAILAIGMSVFHHQVFFITLYCLILAASLWLFSPGIRPHRVLMDIINGMPGSSRILKSLDSARICSICSILLERRRPLHEALATASEMVDSKHTRIALQHASEIIVSGGNMNSALTTENAVDDLIAMTFANTPEESLVAELGQLAEIYEHRVTLSVRSAGAVWTILSIILMSLTVGTVIIAMFMPLMSLVSSMAY